MRLLFAVSVVLFWTVARAEDFNYQSFDLRDVETTHDLPASARHFGYCAAPAVVKDDHIGKNIDKCRVFLSRMVRDFFPNVNSDFRFDVNIRDLPEPMQKDKFRSAVMLMTAFASLGHAMLEIASPLHGSAILNAQMEATEKFYDEPEKYLSDETGRLFDVDPF